MSKLGRKGKKSYFFLNKGILWTLIASLIKKWKDNSECWIWRAPKSTSQSGIGLSHPTSCKNQMCLLNKSTDTLDSWTWNVNSEFTLVGSELAAYLWLYEARHRLKMINLSFSINLIVKHYHNYQINFPMEFKHSCRKWSNFSYLSSNILYLNIMKIK